jgi:hypothetical protein
VGGGVGCGLTLVSHSHTPLLYNKRRGRIMPFITYPDGHKTFFMWINKEYGYIRRNGKIYRYHLPK